MEAINRGPFWSKPASPSKGPHYRDICYLTQHERHSFDVRQNSFQLIQAIVFQSQFTRASGAVLNLNCSPQFLGKTLFQVADIGVIDDRGLDLSILRQQATRQSFGLPD